MSEELEPTKQKVTSKARFNLDAVKAVSARAAQKMTNSEEQPVTTTSTEVSKKNPKGAGRKHVQEPAKNKISVNLTDTELEKLNVWCTENGMKPASVLRYCLTKLNVL